MIAAGGASLLLGLEWGGDKYAWASSTIIGLFAVAAASIPLFILQERRAAEPIIPLRLFKNSVFSVTSVLSFLVGMVMFGAIIFLPEYQQIVRGDTATKSGLMIFPLVLGILIASITSGRLISKLGRYRQFPILGTALLIFSFSLFSTITSDTNRWLITSWMIVLGLGLGQLLPVLTLAVQNAVERKDLGTATSSVTFFRNIGSAIGAAVFGAVLSNRLAHHISQSIPGDAGVQAAASLEKSITNIGHLPPNILNAVLASFGNAFGDVFLFGVPFAFLAFLVALKLKDVPLQDNESHAKDSATS